MNEKTKKDEVRKGDKTHLAFRIWRADKVNHGLYSANVTGASLNTWVGRGLSQPEGMWPKGDVMEARCRRKGGHRAPDPACSCGIYATTSLATVDDYLRGDARVLGLVELGGLVIPGQRADRAEYAVVAAILLIDEMFTEDHAVLRDLADAYSVPALRPHSADPEDYRSQVCDTEHAQAGDLDEEWRRMNEDL